MVNFATQPQAEQLYAAKSMISAHDMPVAMRVLQDWLARNVVLLHISNNDGDDDDDKGDVVGWLVVMDG